MNYFYNNLHKCYCKHFIDGVKNTVCIEIKNTAFIELYLQNISI